MWHGHTYTNSGTYTHAYNNADGCASVDTLHLTIYPTYQIPVTASICQGDSYNFFGQTLTSAGAYTHTLRTVHGCDSVITLTLTVAAAPTLTLSVDHMTMCAGGMAMLSAAVNASNQLPNNFSYEWILDGGTPVTGVTNTYNLTLNTAGYHTVQARVTQGDAFGCTSALSSPVTVIVAEPPVVSLYVTDGTTVCSGGTTTLNGIITNYSNTVNGVTNATIYDGLTFNWTSNGVVLSSHTNVHFAQDQNAFTMNTPGTYAYQVSVVASGYNCQPQLSNVETVMVAPAYSATVSGSGNVCEGGAVTLNVTVNNVLPNDALGYQWYRVTSGSSSVIAGATSSTYAISDLLSVGSYDYYVAVTSSIPGCNATSAIHPVNVLARSVVSITETACDSYTWNNTTYTQSGIYTQNFTNINGCDSVVTLQLTILHGTHNVETETACESFTWHGHTYTNSGTYTHAYNNADGCASVDTLHLTINPLPVVTVSVDDTLVCEGGMVTLTANVAPATVPCIYQWYRDGALVPDVVSSSYVVMNEARVTAYHYAVSVTTNAGCSATVAAPAIMVWPEPTVTITREAGYPDTVCEGGSTVIKADVTGGYGTNIYHWSKNGVELMNEIGPVLSVVVPNDGSIDYYFMTVSQPGAGCVAFSSSVSISTLVTIVPTYTVVVTGADNVCEGDTVTMSATVQGVMGGDVLSYQWYRRMNGSEAVAISGATSSSYTISSLLPVGSYDYYVAVSSSISGCDATSAVHTVNVLSASVVNISATACDSYTWNNTTYTQSGIYTQNFTNINGCDSVVTLHLTILHGTHNVETETACESFTWHGHTYTNSGTYTHAYNNADGCASVDTLKLTIYPIPTVTITGNTVICEGLTTQLTATGGSSYVWNNAATTNSITVGQSGTYSVTATSAEGCSAAANVVVTVNTTPQIVIIGNTTICAGSSTTLTATGAANYIWNTGDQSASLQVNAFGMYSVTGTSAAGCVGTADVVVLVSPLPNITIAGSTDICPGDSTTLVAQGGVSYIWNNGNTDATLSVYSAGDYQVMGFDAAGCHNTASVTVQAWDFDVTEETVSVSDSCYIWHGESYCQSGDYVQTLQNMHGCDSVVTLHLTVAVGIDSYGDDYSIRAYPNPTGGVVTIESDDPMQELTEAMLYNAMGELVRMSRWNTGSRQRQIDLSGLGSGLYFVRLYSHGHFVGFVKVVKQ
jgi:hypothetical protein